MYIHRGRRIVFIIRRHFHNLSRFSYLSDLVSYNVNVLSTGRGCLIKEIDADIIDQTLNVQSLCKVSGKTQLSSK